jgi:competence protein ComFC
MTNFCEACKRTKWEFSGARSSLVFDGEIKSLIYRFKYGGEKYLARFIAEFLCDTYYESDFTADIVTFVPLHKKRERKRGYNQAALLAAALGSLINKPVLATLTKNSHTRNMARLNFKQRQKLIEGSFSPIYGKNADNADNKGSMPDIVCSDMSDITADNPPENPLKNKNVLLIDDVFTTGATANECASRLIKSGCAEVFVLTAASVPLRVGAVQAVKKLSDIESQAD